MRLLCKNLDKLLLIDGRNRLAAVELLGGTIHIRQLRFFNYHYSGSVVARIISKNIHRRHLTKQQQADLIVAAHKASRKDCEMPKRHVKGKAGSAKDPIKEAAVKDAAAHGIGKRTVEQAFAKVEGKPQASPEEIAAKRKAAAKKREADRKARDEWFEVGANVEAYEEWLAARPTVGDPPAGPRKDAGSWQTLAKVLVRLGSNHEGEQQTAAKLANKILQPMGWQLVKA